MGFSLEWDGSSLSYRVFGFCIKVFLYIADNNGWLLVASFRLRGMVRFAIFQPDLLKVLSNGYRILSFVNWESWMHGPWKSCLTKFLYG